MSEDPALHQKESPLLEALDRIAGLGMGTGERHPVVDRMQYVRFVIGRKDERGHVEQWVFRAAGHGRQARFPLSCSECRNVPAGDFRPRSVSDLT